jgi:hypothetical protein
VANCPSSPLLLARFHRRQLSRHTCILHLWHSGFPPSIIASSDRRSTPSPHCNNHNSQPTLNNPTTHTPHTKVFLPSYRFSRHTTIQEPGAPGHHHQKFIRYPDPDLPRERAYPQPCALCHIRILRISLLLYIVSTYIHTTKKRTTFCGGFDNMKEDFNSTYTIMCCVFIDTVM